MAKTKAETMRKYRTLKHIKSIVNKYDAISLCFSFTDETLNNTNEQTRLQYIKRYLNAFASDYVLNKDYGKKHGREHYHAIATPKYKIFLCDAYKLGNIEFKKIHNNGYYQNININNDAIASRFYYHATKETTQQSKIIFARKSRLNKIKYKKQINDFLNNKNDFISFMYDELEEIDTISINNDFDAKEYLKTINLNKYFN